MFILYKKFTLSNHEDFIFDKNYLQIVFFHLALYVIKKYNSLSRQNRILYDQFFAVFF